MDCFARPVETESKVAELESKPSVAEAHRGSLRWEAAPIRPLLTLLYKIIAAAHPDKGTFPSISYIKAGEPLGGRGLRKQEGEWVHRTVKELKETNFMKGKRAQERGGETCPVCAEAERRHSVHRSRKEPLHEQDGNLKDQGVVGVLDRIR
ncbi:hypothetical protein NDU88_000424 [Pleurodeles waltl]|uniref:Uncharacterized protein n=1 Tax=Pleurodeles waltl TaxID=8319 RepID=A0AAV7LVU2_PLEWA|nr:hypothetical protein NDU88_000424 [Pleurodeles waltl]